MIHLAWEQKENLQIVLMIPVSGSVKGFLLDLSAVNFLVSTHKVSLFIKTSESEEQEFHADFRGLKPVAVQNTNDISVLVNDPQTTVTADYCAISRGEQFQERWLSPDGWSEQCFHFALTPTLLKGETRPSGIITHGAGITTASCPYCNALLTGSEFKCPRCGNLLKATPPVQEGLYPSQSNAIPQEFPLRVIKTATVADTKKTKKHFALFLVFSLLTLALFIFHFNIEYADFFASAEDASIYAMLISCLVFNCFLVSHIYLLALIYRMWDLIQDQPCRTTPGVAVWLLVTPIWQLGWAFTAVRGLAIDVNSYYKNIDGNAQTGLMSPLYALLLCILGLICATTVFAYLFVLRTDTNFETFRLSFFLSNAAFITLLIPYGASIRTAYAKIAELKQK